MPSMYINGANIAYEELGSGQPVVLTPGGRLSREAVRPLAELLAPHYRVIIYDRRNCGASDVTIGGELSEQELWVEDLRELLSRLNATPAYIGGGSAGCRVSLMLAVRYPEMVKGLLLWLVTGGAVAAEQLGYTYYEEYIEIAARAGMKGVTESPFFAERIMENPSNRERLLAMDPGEFIRVMRRWRTFFTADDPVIGATEAELRAILAPTAVVPGNDDIHPQSVGENLHRILPHSQLHPPTWTPEERERLAERDPQEVRREAASRLSNVFLPFLAQAEAARATL